PKGAPADTKGTEDTAGAQVKLGDVAASVVGYPQIGPVRGKTGGTITHCVGADRGSGGGPEVHYASSKINRHPNLTPDKRERAPPVADAEVAESCAIERRQLGDRIAELVSYPDIGPIKGHTDRALAHRKPSQVCPVTGS